MGDCTIRPIRYVDVLDAPNAEQLLAEYSAECSLPVLGSPNPTREGYATLEAIGLQTVGCFHGDRLVGFATVLPYLNPHYNVRLAATESLFISPEFRRWSLGSSLLNEVESIAQRADCVAIQYSAPVGSRLATVLSRRAHCTQTNAVFTRRLA